MKNRLKVLRAERDWSQADLADKLNVSRQTVNAIELGKYSPAGYASFNADEVGAHLLQGTAAMSINWPAWISSFKRPCGAR